MALLAAAMTMAPAAEGEKQFKASATAPAAFIVEYSLGHNPLMHDLVAEAFPVIDGRIEIPDRPGLGLTIDDDFVVAHSVD